MHISYVYVSIIELKFFLIFKVDIMNYFNFQNLKIFPLKLNFCPIYSSNIHLPSAFLISCDSKVHRKCLLLKNL